ncbi:MAG: L-seryl-tRNA(Sec) selenium transferase [Sphaerochaetaceae bacterium]|jgi:L-seryl-tRNA(Ser) seleniumtransferase
MDKLSELPQVETIVSDSQLSHWIRILGRPRVVDVVRSVLHEIRGMILHGQSIDGIQAIIDQVAQVCQSSERMHPIRVVNCSGILIHTNLGRSPLSESVWDAVKEANCRYTNLEFNLSTGKRGNRADILSDLLHHMTGSEDAIVVNNNAAALFLLLAAVAKGKRVLVSRGELVQIGGGFRIHEIMQQSGAELVEVGTTNITTVSDYVNALDENTAMVLKVHRSNFSIHGFTNEASVDELAKAIGRRAILAVDQGSGAHDNSVPGEISTRTLFKQGADIITFSGDKLIGSVQIGCICGKTKIVKQLAKHPLYRVLRPGKTVLSIFEHTLIDRLNTIPSVPGSFFKRSMNELREMGNSIISITGNEQLALVESPMAFGGGSDPEGEYPSVAIKIDSLHNPHQILKMLRDRPIPIIAIIIDSKVHLHLAAVFDDEITIIASAIRDVLKDLACI